MYCGQLLRGTYGGQATEEAICVLELYHGQHGEKTRQYRSKAPQWYVREAKIQEESPRP